MLLRITAFSHAFSFPERGGERLYNALTRASFMTPVPTAGVPVCVTVILTLKNLHRVAAAWAADALAPAAGGVGSRLCVGARPRPLGR